MQDIKLSDIEKEKVNELHKNIYDNGNLGNDIMMLLYDGVESLKNNLFYSSIATLTIFLEKYLRDILIRYEYEKDLNKSGENYFMEYLDKIEEQIEDGKDEDKKKYMFSKICDKLVEYKKIDQGISDELKGIYESIRIPVQHGIYARVIKKQIGDGSVPIIKMKVTDDMTSEELINTIKDGSNSPFNDTMKIHNPIARMFVLPEFFKNESIKMLIVIDSLVRIVEKIK